MKGIPLKDWKWVAHIEYAGGDTELHFAGADYPTILAAVDHVYRHLRTNWPWEIVSLQQVSIYKKKG